MDLAAEIKRLAESKLTNESHFIVEVVISSRQGPRKVLIFMDGDQGVSIDACADLSREMASALDENNWIEDHYTLEVSTAGVDQPLKLVRQYKKNIGRNVKVKLKESVIEGKLTDVSEERIVVNHEIGSGKNKEIKTAEIPFTEIERTIVMVSFK
jgi:ribosome maturation factor RimP